MTLNETSGKQEIQSYINFNDIWKGNAYREIMVTLNETSGKQGNQGIQSYIADMEWNISEYNDVWKGNPLIYWWYWIKYQGHRESNHILILLNEMLSDYNDIHGKEINRHIEDIEWNTRETGKTGNPIIYCWYSMKNKGYHCNIHNIPL